MHVNRKGLYGHVFAKSGDITMSLCVKYIMAIMYRTCQSKASFEERKCILADFAACFASFLSGVHENPNLQHVMCDVIAMM